VKACGYKFSIAYQEDKEMIIHLVATNLSEPIQLHLRTTNCLKRWGKGKIGQNQLPLTSIGQGPMEVDIFNGKKI
jgi:hypothetical protein